MDVEEPILGPLLRRHRTEAGLTQEELAERAEISARTVSDVERGLRHTVYRDTAQRLATALGLAGEQRTRFESVARGRRRTSLEGRLDADALPPGAVIPGPPTQLIGRVAELEAVRSAILRPDVRLLTVTGPGGIGKTRLAVEATTRAAPDVEDGAFFVPLGATHDAGLVAAVVAHAVGARRANREPEDALIEHFRGRRALLVLDTFEHLLEAGLVISNLLSACPGVTVLVTSRAPLRLRGEREIGLGPLELAADPRLSGDATRSPATALFLERARAASPELRLDEGTAPIMAEICRRVEGVPLAIELAAARAKHLTLGALSDQLEHRLRVLVGGPRDLPPRQRTMRDTVAWSYELLGPSERELFRQLSIFAGGWTLEAAESVCAPDHPSDVLAWTSALIDQSLVFLDRASVSAPRYGMLDVINEYAAERRTAGGDAPQLGRRHAEYFVALAEEAEPQLGGASQRAWFRRLDEDSANLRAALRWALGQSEVEMALRLSGALWQFWRRRGDIAEGRSWLEAALGMDGATEATARAKALWGAAWLAYHQGDFDRSESLGEELLSSSKRTGDRTGERNGLTILGKVATARGRHGEAVEPLRKALAICRELGDGWLLATSLFNLGTAMLLVGDTEQGEALIGEALARYRERGDEHFTARATGYLAYPALSHGDVERARSFTRASLELSIELADMWGIAEGMERISAVSAAAGDADRAARVAGAAEALRATIAFEPMPEDLAMIRPHLAGARSQVGDEGWRESLGLGRSMSLTQAIQDALGDETEGPG